jgi:putative ABC transport system permease protein
LSRRIATGGWILPLSLAWRETRSHFMRSVVTATAVFMGVASLLVMTALSRGMQAQNEEMYLRMGGAQVIQMSATKGKNALEDASFGRSRGLRLSDVAVLAKDLPQFDGWVPEVSVGRTQISIKGKRVRGMGTASTWDRFDVLGITLDESLDLTRVRWESGEAMLVVGSEVANSVSPGIPSAALGKELNVNGRPARIAGIFKSQGKFDFRNMEVMLPLAWYTRIQGDADPTLSKLKARLARLDDVADAPRQLEAELLALHRGVKDVEVSTNDDLLENSRKTIATMSLVTLLIASVSLLSGAVGILNVGLASLSSRVQELGTSKAIGASSRLLFRQVLFESLLVAGLGGVAGLAVGLAPALIPTGTLPWTLQLSAIDLFGGLFLSVGVGVVSGMVPAVKAARLDPVEAMRA